MTVIPGNEYVWNDIDTESRVRRAVRRHAGGTARLQRPPDAGGRISPDTAGPVPGIGEDPARWSIWGRWSGWSNETTTMG